MSISSPDDEDDLHIQLISNMDASEPKIEISATQNTPEASNKATMQVATINIDKMKDSNTSLPTSLAADPIPLEIAAQSNKAEPADEIEEVEAVKPAAELCGVCNEKERRYKCSRCELPYCSISCSTIHKAIHPPLEPKAPEPTPPTTVKSNGVARPGTVAGAQAKNPFAGLDDSQQLQLLFKKYPRLPQLLIDIDNKTLPPTNLSLAWQPGKKGNKNWTLDSGFQQGRRELNRLRDENSEDGESIREFSELILHILSGDAGISAEQMIQKEIREENAKIIEQLLNGEL